MHSKPLIEPIRKPRSKKQFELRKHQRIARTLHNQVVQFDNKIFLVSESVELKNLTDFLCTTSDWNDCDKEAFFRAFGCVGELTVQLLNRVSASLDYWARSLQSCLPKSSLYRYRLEQMEEVEKLRSTMKFAFRTLEQKVVWKSNFVLEPAQEREFEQQFHSAQFEASSTGPLNHRQLPLFRFVYWAGKLNSLRRFLSAMTQTRDPETHLIDQVDSFARWCEVLLKRWDCDTRWVVAFEFKTNKEYENFLCLADKQGFKPPIKRAGFPERIENHLAALKVMRKKLLAHRDVHFPLAMAAWAIGSKLEVLPTKTVQRARNQTSSTSALVFAKHYLRAEAHAGFPQAIELMERRDAPMPMGVLRNVGAWFASGNDSGDIEFCLDKLEPLSIDHDINLRKLRKSAERSMLLLNENKPTSFQSVHDYYCSNFRIEMIDTVFRWMEKFPSLKLNKQTKATVCATLDSLSSVLKSSSAEAIFVARLKQWASTVNAVAECFPNESSYPKNLRSWLRRLGYYQRLTGGEVKLPKSLRKSLMVEEKRSKELNFLAEQVRQGTASRKAQERLTHLANSKIDGEKSRRKNIRDTQEACLLVGLEALRKLIIQEASQVWVGTMEQPVHSTWSETRIAEMGNWVRRMSPQQLAFCKSILSHFVDHGANYKSRLAFNKGWIEKMQRKGFAIEHWIFPQEKLTKIKDRDVTISLSTDPYEIFMMGNYFGTCLSQGGCNQMSVLPNAADANKQVIYVRDLDGTVLSRQLIAINRKGQLLHYCLYIANKDVTGEDCYEDYRVAVDRFCHELAARVGLQVGDLGAPASLGNQFWYDDGAEEWKEQPLPLGPRSNCLVGQVESNPVGLVGFVLQAGCSWPAVSCTQSSFEYEQLRFEIVAQ